MKSIYVLILIAAILFSGCTGKTMSAGNISSAENGTGSNTIPIKGSHIEIAEHIAVVIDRGILGENAYIYPIDEFHYLDQRGNGYTCFIVRSSSSISCTKDIQPTY